MSEYAAKRVQILAAFGQMRDAINAQFNAHMSLVSDHNSPRAMVLESQWAHALDMNIKVRDAALAELDAKYAKSTEEGGNEQAQA